ncbi:uncharacterized protein LOC124996186 [Mugil cephalus]|uniref:uncharacterized protein LOC124996186 n=1 Tax=Mugil cephalus TaxID=48193 RepID=UPI001FB6FB79|nr:uncharacterized protein LOC124996186 [Mugil cephalus]
MASYLTQDAVLHFLQSNGGSVKNSELVLHFKPFIRGHVDQDRNRELFKKFVNSVATVKPIDGVSYVVLRKKFKGHVPGGPVAPRPPAAAGKNPKLYPENAAASPPLSTQNRPRKQTPAPAVEAVLPAAGIIANNNNNNDDVETNLNLKQKQQVKSAPEFSSRPATGVSQISNKTGQKTPIHIEPPASGQCIREGQQRLGSGPPPPGITPAPPAYHRETSHQVLAPEPLRGREAHVQPQGGLHQTLPLRKVILHPQVKPHRVRHRPSYKCAVSCDEDEEEGEEEVPMGRRSAEGVWPLNSPLCDTGKAISGSSPCLTNKPAPLSASLTSPSHSSLDRKPPKMLTSQGQGLSLEAGLGMRGEWARPEPESYPAPLELFPVRHTPPLEAEHHMPSLHQAAEAELLHSIHQEHRLSQPAGVQMELNYGFYPSGKTRLSSSHSSIFSPSPVGSFPRSNWSSPGSPRYSPREWYSSSEELQAQPGERVGVAIVQEALYRAQEPRPSSGPHGGGVRTSVPWHHSTGHLCDDQEPGGRLSPLHRSNDHLHFSQDRAAQAIQWQLSTDNLRHDRERADPSGGSISPPKLRPGASKRLSSRLRSRMCRSLGTDLDQLLQEEEARGGGAGGNEAARLDRLHRISSSLSLRYNLSSSSLSSCSTPPRCQSVADLVEGRVGKEVGGNSSPAVTHHHEAHDKHSLFPLEAKEHAWLVKGAAGAWSDIYSLFREDPSLLNKQDFISGFTVLHWIAKHGDHRVLNTLWYGVEKAGMTLDVNAKSTSGHTPLHIAAMHSNKNIIRLLINKFKANVKLRDIAGKKAWQYLSPSVSVDIFKLLGAPPRAAVTGEGGVGIVDQSWTQKSHRHRRHHLSAASSGQRPLTIVSGGKVKRSTSIAALLKPKSLHLFYAHQSDSSV